MLILTEAYTRQVTRRSKSLNVVPRSHALNPKARTRLTSRSGRDLFRSTTRMCSCSSLRMSAEPASTAAAQ